MDEFSKIIKSDHFWLSNNRQNFIFPGAEKDIEINQWINLYFDPKEFIGNLHCKAFSFKKFSNIIISLLFFIIKELLALYRIKH